MTVVASIYVALSDWALAFANRDDVRTAAVVFLVILWTCVGISILIDRRRPRTVKSEQDYRYGLTFEGFHPVIGAEFDQDDSELRFAIQLRNFSSGPIKYMLEDVDIRIGNRALPLLLKGTLFGFMARGSGRTSTTSAFKRRDFKELVGHRLEGTAKFIIVYGHPEMPPVRQLTITMSLVLEIPEKGPFGFGSNILGESDIAITWVDPIATPATSA